MKKKIILSLFFVCSLASAVITSCKKNDNSSTTTTTTAQLDAQTQQNNYDQNNYKSESDQNDNDVNAALNGSSMMGMRLPASNGSERLGYGTNSILYNPTAPCGATIDSSQISSKKIIFNFDGVTHCGYWPIRTRSGQITVQLTGANKWDNPGAVLTISFNNYKVTRLDNGHWIQFNGVKTLTDSAGFNALTFLLGSTIITYKERVHNMQVTFDGGDSAVWNSSRTVWWKCNSFATGDYTFTTIGDTIINGNNNMSEWGTNRFNTGFVIYYNSQLVCNSLCSNYWKPTSGEIVYDVLNTNSTVAGSFTFDLNVDSHGTILTSGCPFYFKVTWVDSNSHSQYTVLPYL